MSRARLLSCVALFALGGCGSTASFLSVVDPANDPTMKLVWSDEFDGYGNASPDPTKWAFDVGTGPNGDGWGNAELEYYTDRPDNARMDGHGHLVIYSLREDYKRRHYTSARLNTKGLFSEVYGHIEARIQIPRGPGMWPAFWMLGDNIDAVGWPTAGEVDVMENSGSEPQIVHGSMHGPGYSGGSALTNPAGLLDGTQYADGFHVYAVDWSREGIRFSVDGKVYETRQPGDQPAGAPWVYDHRFYLLLNVAVGGNFVSGVCPASFPACVPDGTTLFPETTLVDYVRWYQRK